MTPTERVQAGLSAVSDKFKKSQGQPGGMSSISSQARKAAIDNLQRQKFFKGRDVPEERLRKRIKQDTLERQFKDRFTKDVNIVDSEGNVTGIVSGLRQATEDAPRSLTKERQRLANLYGPTLSEVIGDIGYGLGQMGKAVGIPFVSNALRIGQAVKSGVEAAWDAVRGKPTTTQGTAFPQPSSDTKDLFSSIDTGIAQVNPNNMLVDIAKQDQRTYEPFRVSNMDISNVVAQNDGLPSLMNMYNFARNPQVNTNYGNFRLDNVLTGNPQMNYGNTVMINGVPVDLSASIGQGGISGGLSFAFNKGGSVDKNGGLGYMFK